MTTAPITDLTPKGERTRDRILNAATQLFAERGYTATTMRDIAEAADCSLGLAYRYFHHKEDLVMALYASLAADMNAYAHNLPMGTVADRFHSTLVWSLEQAKPYRAALGALFGASMQPDSEITIVEGSGAQARTDMLATFKEVVDEANDCPQKPDVAAALGTLMYTVYMLVMLAWMYDRTDKQRGTVLLVEFLHEALSLLRPMLLMPIVGKAIIKASTITLMIFDAVPVDEKDTQNGHHD